MAFIEWSQELSVGVEEIDEQHKRLIEIINHAHEVSLEKDRKEGLEILNELIEFVRVHFSTEEKYFEQCNYSGAEEHVAEHMRLTEKVLKFKLDFDSGECNYREFLDFLGNWLVEHLKGMDRRYIETFKKCGLK